jgi:protein arginine N-methyltransferase 1
MVKMTKPYTYPLASFGRFMSDRVRTSAYKRALQDVVNRNSVVLNIGAGTGLFALLAAQLGVRRVIAIEANDVIDLARRFARDNGLADHIDFIQALSTEVSLDEPADVIISDLHGVVPLFQHHIPTIVDARQRLLAPGGILIPHEDKLWAALARTPSYYNSHFDRPWNRNEYGFDMTAARDLLINDWQRVYLRPNQLASVPALVATLDYQTISDPTVGATLSWTIDRRQTLHGFVIWFDAQLHGEHRFSNRPGEPKLIYGQAFFPFEHPVETLPGDTFTIRITADFFDGEYVWKWVTTVTGASEDVRVEYRQSSIWQYLTKKSVLTGARSIAPDSSPPQSR